MAVHGIGWKLVAIGLLAHSLHARICVHIYLLVLVATEVSYRCSEFDVLQILIG